MKKIDNFCRNTNVIDKDLQTKSLSSHQSCPVTFKHMSLVQDQKNCYRKAKQIPKDISRQCDIFFDEGLFINALNLLNSILTIGAAQPNILEAPAFAPLAFHIELASTLLIHPRYTNQTSVEEHSEIASRSITFLRNVLEILGPINANLIEAFSFGTLNRNKKPSEEDNDTAVGVEDRVDEFAPKIIGDRFKNLIGNNGRIRRCAKDFWHMVGWSFNCSIRYPQRWKYMKVWLEYILDVLQADSKERNYQNLDLFLSNSFAENHELGTNSQSIILSYLSDVKSNSTAVRGVLKSIFVDGSTDSLISFPEVFPNETKMLKYHNRQEKRNQNLDFHRIVNSAQDDVDEADLTDYDLSSYFEKDKVSADEYWMGGADSIILRQRLITLLSDIARISPNNFIRCIDLHALMYDYIRPLPLPLFAYFMSSSKSSQISEAVYIPLCQMILSRLLPKSAHSPSADHLEPEEFSQIILQKFYLPFTALTSSCHDNAKVSILMENLLRLLLKNHVCHYTPDLEMALESGIIAREEKIQKQKKRRQNTIANPSNNSDAIWLKDSSIRLRSLISWLKTSRKKNVYSSNS